jgi:hypothetical protein
VAALFVSVLAGCAPTIPRQPLGTAPAAAAPPIDAAAPSTWLVRRSQLSAEYRIDQEAQVVTDDSSHPLSDSVRLSIDASLRFTGASGSAGLIRSAMLRTSGGIETPLPGVVFPLAYSTAPFSPRSQPAFTSARSVRDGCGDVDPPVLSPLRDVLFAVPDTIRLGMMWSDSGRYRTCRDGVPLDVTSRRDFSVVAVRTRGALDVLILRRRGIVAVRGFAARGTDTTWVLGTGASTMDLELDAPVLRLRAAVGEGSLDLTIRGARRTEHAREQFRSRVTLTDR